MDLAVIAKRAILSYTVSGESSSSELILECRAAEQSGVFEIGENHVFADESQIRPGNKRRSCAFRLYIRRRSCLTEKRIAKLGLSDEKIGELGFYPDYEQRDFVPARPASLEAFVFVGDQTFDGLTNTLQAGGKTESIFVYLKERKGILEFGWEPDGSRMVWKIDDATKPAYVDVTELQMRLSLID